MIARHRRPPAPRIAASLALAGALCGCSLPVVPRAVPTTGPVYGLPAYEKNPGIPDSAYGVGPAAGEGPYRVIPVDPNRKAPVEGP